MATLSRTEKEPDMRNAIRARLPARAALLWFLAAWAAVCLCPHGTGQESPPTRYRPAGENALRFGVLFWHDSPNDAAALAGIREALEEAGKPHAFDIGQADSSREKAVRLLEGFRQEPVDLVFAMGTEAALLAAEHVRDIPVVYTAVTNPVVSGVVPSWEGSGTNLAGNSNWIASETVLRVFRLAVPDLRKLGILRSENVVSAAELRAMREHLGAHPEIDLVQRAVKGVEEIGPAVEALAASGVQAIWIPIDILVYENMDEVLEAAEARGLPLVSSSLKAARAGAVAGVLIDYRMLGKKAVVMALDILENKKAPGAMPVGRMHGYQVIVNLGAARRCRYEVPLSLLVVADLILEETPDPEGEKDE
jgi:putative ABC transport system substrate-binding protein